MPRHNNRRNRVNLNKKDAPLQYPKYSKGNSVVLASVQARRALDLVTEFSNQQLSSWGPFCPNHVLAEAQKALNTINFKTASTLMLRDHLEVAVMNLTRMKNEVDTKTGGWANLPTN
ncbi:hypothetical protein HWV62_37045 [Athelia sp. TMB]|nr:hypothetical protein HWV62_37045 [Athelia sp. TMB]